MLFKTCLLSCLTLMVIADNPTGKIETRVEQSVSFETSHKNPNALEESPDSFETSHKINLHSEQNESEISIHNFNNLQGAMNLLPTKERPELNPILSALINEDVMKSIEAKRAIEEKELRIVEAEADAPIKRKGNMHDDDASEGVDEVTEGGVSALTTAAPIKKADIDDDINVGFVDQTINLETAGSENNKKSRIEIKKGPNGQDYEYEYVYYYEDEDDDTKSKSADSVAKEAQDTRGKSRYSNIERSTTASVADNSLESNKVKGRSSSAGADKSSDGVETERLPSNTRFPSRKSGETQPTPALDSIENAAEKKKISVKRPSLELVDSETFNTDEKQPKGTRNGDTEAKVNQPEQSGSTKATSKKAEEKQENGEESVTSKPESDDDAEQTTQSMEKAALDLYAILANENFNMDMTTDADMEVTTILPDTTSADEGDNLTTMLEMESSSSTTTTTTTTTTEAPTTTTTTTTPAAPSIYGGKRGGPGAAGRNRFKLKKGGLSTSTTTTTEAPAPSDPVKPGRNRFARPPIGGRNRLSAKTTPEPAPASNEDEVVAKEVKPVNSAFGRNKPRNRFNVRGTSTTEKPSEESAEGGQEEVVPSSTARTLRGRPTLNLRGRSRSTTTQAPAAADKDVSDSEDAAEEKAPAPVKPSRFNLNRSNGNRLLPRGKLGRTTEAPASDDSAADSSHHNDVKGEGDENADKTEVESTPSAGGLSRAKNRPRLNTLQKTEGSKAKVAASPVAPRKVNPLLAKRRLHLGPSTTEAAPAEDDASATADAEEAKDETASAADDDAAKNEEIDEMETTTKQQARGLGLLGQRRRLPARKPGTIL